MLKFLLIIIMLYLAYQLFIKPFLRSFISSYTGYGNSRNQNNSRYEHKRDGRINIDHVPNNRTEFKDGEYIDYEEVKK